MIFKCKAQFQTFDAKDTTPEMWTLTSPALEKAKMPIAQTRSQENASVDFQPILKERGR